MIYSSSASASCPTDTDGDSYSPSGTDAGCFIGTKDCDDGDATVNPGEFEDLGDGTDQDCDGRDAMARFFSAGAFTSATWPGTGAVTYGTDGITVGDVSSGGLSTATRTLNIGRTNGATGVMLDVTSGSGAACNVELDTSPWGGGPPITTHSEAIPGAGTRWVPFPTVLPRHVLRAVRLSCVNFSRVEVDWLQVQNATDPVPPPGDIALHWTDTRAPGGGYIESVVRDDRYASLWMGTDVAGVAVADRDGLGAWDVTNGTGLGSLLMQGNLAVADIEPMPDPDDGVYALMGDAFELSETTRTIVGGLWWSGDSGASWTQLASSWNDAYALAAGLPWASEDDDVATMGLETNCPGGRPGGVTWEPGGGRLLQSDDYSSAVGDVIYIANNDEDATGVSIYAQGEACPLPNDGTALPAERVGAILRVDAPGYGTPVLLVGYRGRADGGEGVYACQLPGWPLACDTPAGYGADCWPVSGSEGVDVRDLELDTWTEAAGDLAAYVVDGGTRPIDTDSDGIGEATCDHAASGVHRLELDDSTGSVVDTWVASVVAEADITMLGAGTDYYLTDASIEPGLAFVYLNAGPASSGAYYEVDRMYRAEAADLALGTATWEAINSGEASTPPVEEADYYEVVRVQQDLDLGGAWLEAAPSGRPHPFPARAAPAEAHSTTWVEGAYGDYAVVAGWATAWMVTGLDATWTDDEENMLGVPDVDSVAQPEGDVDWTFWPDISPGFTYQTFATTELAFDTRGNTWIAAGDHGILQYDAPGWLATGEGAAIDCLWKGWPAGGKSVSVGIDDSVWATLIDQTAADGRHGIAVIRSLDAGVTWNYAGAAYASDHMNPESGERWCIDNEDTYFAAPFDPTSTYPGTQFSQADVGAEEDPTSVAYPSLGNPTEVRALDANAAVVLFQPEGASDGGLYLTVDGGENWQAVPFDGAAASTTCDELTTWSAGRFELVHPGGEHTYWAEDPTTGDVSWSFDLLFSVSLGDGWDDYPSAGSSECSVARVRVTPGASGDPEAEWDWIPVTNYLESEYTPTTCGVTSRVIAGATVAPWTEDIVIWGGYRRFWKGSDPTEIGNRPGGACLLNWNEPGTEYWSSSTGAYGSYTMLVNPAVDEVSIGWVAPHPDVADLYAVLPTLDLVTRAQCEAVRQSTQAACPDFPYPRLVSRAGNGAWSTTVLPTHPPSGRASHAAWSHLGVPDDQGGNGTGSWLGVATQGSGAWRGEITW